MATKKAMGKKKAPGRGRAGKPATRRRAAPSQRISTMKGGVVVGGDVNAGRDIIMGDQYNYDARRVANIASAQEFVAELEKLRAQIAALKQAPALTPAQAQTVQVVEGQVTEVIEEAKRPQPLGARITATLTGAKAVMDSLAGGVTSAVGLGAALAGFGQIALKLFGG